MGEDLDKTQGRVKETAGDLTGDRDLEDQGKVDQAAGSVKKTVGDAVDKVKDTLRRD
jgi:uncharacterized protein YjbJ (UPF0337 family)